MDNTRTEVCLNTNVGKTKRSESHKFLSSLLFFSPPLTLFLTVSLHMKRIQSIILLLFLEQRIKLSHPHCPPYSKFASCLFVSPALILFLSASPFSISVSVCCVKHRPWTALNWTPSRGKGQLCTTIWPDPTLFLSGSLLHFSLTVSLSPFLTVLHSQLN